MRQHAVFCGRFSRLVVLALALLPLFARGQPASPPAPSHTLLADTVSALAASTESSKRAQALMAQITRMGLSPRPHRFSARETEGTNILVTPRPAKNASCAANTKPRRVLLGAHYDSVDAGQGAVDNASGVAAVLGLLRHFQAQALCHTRFEAVFFDLEEKGLLGSLAYVNALKKTQAAPDLFINFDVFGYGDALWLMRQDARIPLVAAMQKTSASQNLQLVAGPDYPPSDHLSFLAAGIPTLSFSLLEAQEIPDVLRVFAQEELPIPPKVMRIIHSPNDVLAEVQPAVMARGVAAIAAGLSATDRP